MTESLPLLVALLSFGSYILVEAMLMDTICLVEPYILFIMGFIFSVSGFF